MESGQFNIKNDEYDGDFDLDIIIKSGQTSQPPAKYETGKYSEILMCNDKEVLVEMSQEGINKPLNVSYYTNDSIDEEEIKSKLLYMFDLDYDITQVYDFILENEKLKDSYEFNKGLRLYKAQFPFECIISSICSANNSIKRWTKSIQQIKKAYGKKIEINNQINYIFPTELQFIDIPNDNSKNGLKSFGVGYRSDYMLQTTSKILNVNNYHDKIRKLNYDDAFVEIKKLDGVGPKVADCILLYGYVMREAYPVDVWINRITSYLFFKDEKPTNNKIMKFAHENFGEYSGYVQLYLFNYARLSGLMDKLKK